MPMNLKLKRTLHSLTRGAVTDRLALTCHNVKVFDGLHTKLLINIRGSALERTLAASMRKPWGGNGMGGSDN
jgi:hypothetical protein